MLQKRRIGNDESDKAHIQRCVRPMSENQCVYYFKFAKHIQDVEMFCI